MRYFKLLLEAHWVILRLKADGTTAEIYIPDAGRNDEQVNSLLSMLNSQGSTKSRH